MQSTLLAAERAEAGMTTLQATRNFRSTMATGSDGFAEKLNMFFVIINKELRFSEKFQRKSSEHYIFVLK